MIQNLRHLILVLLCIIYSTAFSQNLQIFGGHSISGLVCADGQVYTWGSNIDENNEVGLLGNRSNKQKVLRPLKVSFPSDIKIKQLDAGSGIHFLAVDTDKNVWGWGANTIGQIGQGSLKPALVKTPKRILKGESDSENSYLSDVTSVSGGNQCSFALLENKRIVAWGENQFAQLGNNSTKNSLFPVYVLDSLKKPLENVVQVDIGDFTSFALVDPDGDGIGTVYSWGASKSPYGGGCMLGRSARGGSNNGTESGMDSLAKPVILKNGSRLDNIIAISAGDVFCLALDNQNNVWAWGNNAWGGVCGQGILVNDFSDPRKVVGGVTRLPFLQAKSISSAQGFAMAITTDNKPVSWGNNTVIKTGDYYSGGFLGIGQSNIESPAPVYIKFGSGINDIDSTVENISNGDLVGFYTTTDKKLYTWGFNVFGQLGIGDTLTRYFATNLDLSYLSCILDSNVVTGYTSGETDHFLLLHPNPANDIVMVADDVTMVTIYNTIGEIVLKSSTSVINVAFLPSGIYHVVAIKNNKYLTQKLVKR